HAGALRHGAPRSPPTSSTELVAALGPPRETEGGPGHVAARGEALGVPVPVNRALHALVRRIELGRSTR
ncbi:MAG: hypothetical protein O9972_41560, partial [Burkholderiales bacterium]|nr:hypothetical protein [Burkholderiales bacterium]